MCTQMGKILPSSPSCSLIFFRSEPPTTPTLTRVLSFWRNWAMTGVTTWTHKHDNDSVIEAVAGCQIGCHESLNNYLFLHNCFIIGLVTGWQQWWYKNTLAKWLFTSFTQIYGLIKTHVCSYLPCLLDFDIFNYCNKKRLVFLSHFKTHIYTFWAITSNSANAPNQEGPINNISYRY